MAASVSGKEARAGAPCCAPRPPPRCSRRGRRGPPPLPITLATHEAALGIAARFGYRIYDSLIIASALEAACATLYSEDMQDGQVIEGRLTIRNPFRS